VTHGGGSEGETGEWSGKPKKPFTLPRNLVYPALLPLIHTPRLPVVDSTDVLADLNGLVHFAERRSLVSARVSSHFKRSLPLCSHVLSQDSDLIFETPHFYQVYSAQHDSWSQSSCFSTDSYTTECLACHQKPPPHHSKGAKFYDNKIS